MKRRGYDNKRDANEKAIVAALEKAGAKVWRLDQPWDLLIYLAGRYYTAECKVGKAELNIGQQERAIEWPPSAIFREPRDAINFINWIRRHAA